MTDSFFSKNQKLWSNYEYRSEQAQMSKAVWESLYREDIQLIEAGTGVGKTLAYLLPLLDFSLKKNVRVVVSTETKALQNQILNKDIQLAEKILGKKMNTQLCLGASNFLCKKSLGQVLDEGNISSSFANSRTMKNFLDWESNGGSGLRQDYPYPLPNHFWQKIHRDPMDCLGSKCPHFEVSPYFVARRSWQKANLLVVNHSLLALHFATDAKLLPEFQHLVIDEAHKFPEIVQKAFLSQANFRDLYMLYQNNKEISKLIQNLELELKELFFKSHSRTKSFRIQVEIESKYAYTLINFLEENIKEKQNKLDQIKSQQSLIRNHQLDIDELDINLELQNLNNYKDLLTALLIEKNKEEEVIWLEEEDKKEKHIIIYRSPLSASLFIQENILPHLSSLIFTSATLNTKKEKIFSYFTKELGFSQGNEPNCLQLNSPFRYKKQALVYLPSKITDPSKNQKQFLEEIGVEINRLLELSKGGAFVLFTSTFQLEQVEKFLASKKRPYKIFSQLNLGPSHALKNFQEEESKRGVLLGLATFWQGVDVVGNRLRMVILTRIPFRVPDEPMQEARWELEQKKGGYPFHSLQMPNAILTMRQGFGRLIRSMKDKGVVALLDPRLQTRQYGKDILKMLPEAPIYKSFSSLDLAYRKLFHTKEIK